MRRAALADDRLKSACAVGSERMKGMSRVVFWDCVSFWVADLMERAEQRISKPRDRSEGD